MKTCALKAVYVVSCFLSGVSALLGTNKEKPVNEDEVVSLAPFMVDGRDLLLEAIPHRRMVIVVSNKDFQRGASKEDPFLKNEETEFFTFFTNGNGLIDTETKKFITLKARGPHHRIGLCKGVFINERTRKITLTACWWRIDGRIFIAEQIFDIRDQFKFTRYGGFTWKKEPFTWSIERTSFRQMTEQELWAHLNSLHVGAKKNQQSAN